MRTRLALFSLFLCLSPKFATQEAQASRYREWLEDVSPIITKTEREIFSRLRTDADREKFIRFFWRQRDPLPDTEENEFYKEYTERVRFADRNFGRDTGKRGSQTDRGYYYLLLGPPLERQFFTTHSQVWPLELWYYRGEVEYGLPPYFYLIFFQPEGLGEYRLYTPGVEGPERLVVPILGPRTITRDRAYQMIKEINAELAGASLNYVPGDQSLQTSSLSSVSLLASVRAVPEKKFSDTYARNYLNYKDHVETEYSDNYVDNSFAAWVFPQSGQDFVHWTLEPRKINFVGRGDRYHAVFELVLRIEDSAGNPVLEKTEEIPLSVTPEQYKAHERRVFAFQDLLPVIPGQFKLFGLLKNKSAQDFTSFSASLTIPSAGEDRPARLLLYHSREKAAQPQAPALKAFSFAGFHYLVNARNEFLSQSEIGAYLRLPRPRWRALDSVTVVRLEIRPLDAAEPSFSREKRLAEVLTEDDEGLDTGMFSLSPLKPGYYAAALSLLDEKGQRLFSASENFILLSQAVPVLPWVYAKSHPSFPNSEYLFLLSTEHFMTKRYDRAAELAAQALELKDDPPTRLLLGKALFAQGLYQDSLDILKPAEQTGQSREAIKVMAADFAGLKDWSAALVHLEKLLAEGTEVSVLNLAGECHLNLNRPERALPLFEKSLEILPDQPEIKALRDKARASLREESSPGLLSDPEGEIKALPSEKGGGDA